tara:strand:- start:31 stop:537 length:507 start_codon:yes stop_codon:yes gene_type:complete
MSPIEMRLNVEAVKPLLEHIRPLLEQLNDTLASPGQAPEDDEMMAEFWHTDLINSQRADVAALVALFDGTFLETGRTVIFMDKADLLVRACTVIRLKLRETSLGEIGDEALESGEFEFEDLGFDARMGYGAYMLFASLQEMIIAQIDKEAGEGDDDDEEEDDEYGSGR